MNKFMEMAIEEAKLGIVEGHGGPFGCVIVKDGVVVGKGHNEVIKNNDPTCHGEMMAIHDSCKNLKTFNLKGCELYTTGEPCLCVSRQYYGLISTRCTTDVTSTILKTSDLEITSSISYSKIKISERNSLSR